MVSEGYFILGGRDQPISLLAAPGTCPASKSPQNHGLTAPDLVTPARGGAVVAMIHGPPATWRILEDPMNHTWGCPLINGITLGTIGNGT